MLLLACINILTYNYCQNNGDFMRDVYDSLGWGNHKVGTSSQPWNIFSRFAKHEVADLLVQQHPNAASMSKKEQGTVHAAITNKLCKQYEDLHGGTAAFDKWLLKWDGKNPVEIKSHRPMNVGKLQDKLLETVNKATEYIRCNGRIADIEAIVFAWSVNPYANPAETAIVSTMSPDISNVLVNMGFRIPVLISHALQAHMQFKGVVLYMNTLSKIVEGITEKIPDMIPTNTSKASQQAATTPQQDTGAPFQLLPSAGVVQQACQQSKGGEPQPNIKLDEGDIHDIAVIEVYSKIMILMDCLRSWVVGMFYDFLVMTIGLSPATKLWKKEDYKAYAESHQKKMPAFLIKSFFPILFNGGYHIENWPVNAPVVKDLKNHGLASPQHWSHAAHVTLALQYCHPKEHCRLHLVCCSQDMVAEPFIKWALGANGRPVTDPMDFKRAGFPLRSVADCHCNLHQGAGEHHTRYFTWDEVLDWRNKKKGVVAQTASPEPQDPILGPTLVTALPPVPATRANTEKGKGKGKAPGSTTVAGISSAVLQPPTVPATTALNTVTATAPKEMRVIGTPVAAATVSRRVKAATAATSKPAKPAAATSFKSAAAPAPKMTSATQAATDAENNAAGPKLRPKPRPIGVAAQKRKHSALEDIPEDTTMEGVEDGPVRLTRGAAAAAKATESAKQTTTPMEVVIPMDPTKVTDGEREAKCTRIGTADMAAPTNPPPKVSVGAQSGRKTAMAPPPRLGSVAGSDISSGVQGGPASITQASLNPPPTGGDPQPLAPNAMQVFNGPATTSAVDRGKAMKKPKIWSDMEGMVEWASSLMARAQTRWAKL
ncbi:hypothetical protein M422DRAFT_53595 [Sphaerobolus stellatus SS14]|uniref:Uncharacterized protein n=1 Tax=Sphaerobolus stellatus (strain SS14) TaxID=990650 RepID=A0A0C9TLK4_SPHS4|nr:hypothetical protein M422DRAFT_53595 [Sphaerobolus stellatus SS14]